MKKTAKTLLSLLLVLVMALQFGAAAPAAFAKGIKDNATINLSVKAPLDEDGQLSASGTPGIVGNPGALNIVELPATAITLQSEGLVLTPPEGFAVTSIYIDAADAESNYDADLPVGTVLVEDGSFAEIAVPASAFTDEAFHGANNTHAYTLFLRLKPAEFVEAQDSTCKTQGWDAYYAIGEEFYLHDAKPLRELSTEHKTPLTHVDGKAATCKEAGYEEYWECDVCGQKFKASDATEENKITAPVVIDQLTTHGTLTPHAKVDATCAAPGTEAYWECEVCHKLFSDAEGTTEITAPVGIPQLTTHGTLTPHAKVDATCAAAGTEAYWECEVCHKKFSDAEGATEITDIVTIPQLTSCDTTKLVKIDAVAPTATTDGNIEHWKCPVCEKLYKKTGDEFVEITEADTILPRTTYDIVAAGTDTTWKKGSTTGAKIEIDADFDAVTVSSVKLGSMNLAESQYDVTEGSVIVTIHPDVLEELSTGAKEVVVTFSDDKTASSTLTIEPPDAAEPTALTLSIDAAGCTKVYDGKSFDLEGLFDHITVAGLPDGYTALVEISYEDSKITEFHDAGTAKVKLHLKTVKDASENDVTEQFTCEDKTGVTLTITKRKIQVETRDDSKVYDGKAWSYTHMTNAQPIMTYTDPKLGEYERSGKTYTQTISIKYTASPKNMGTYDNKAELIIREKEKGSSATGTDVSKNYEITYKFGKIKITDSKGNVPKNNSPATGDENNLWLWGGLMAAAVILVVVILVFTRKGKKNNDVPNT